MILIRLFGSRRPPTLAGASVIVTLLIGLIGVDRAAAITQLRAGQTAPAIELPDLDGTTVALDQLRGGAVVLIFGELYHDKTIRACGQMQHILTNPRLADQKVTALLIVAQDVEAASLRRQAEAAGVHLRILQDRRRRAFGAYEVAVMPSTVVIDPKGKVVYAIAGIPGRWSDVMADAVRGAVGQITMAQFEQSLAEPGAQPQADPSQLRAARLTQLAGQLANRGMADLAMQKYRQALGLWPDYGPALLGLGQLLLARRHLADAEKAFEAALAAGADPIAARLGLGYIQALRGGDELPQAERHARDLLSVNPSEPRAHFLLGMIQEQRGEYQDAAASYKRSAELLLQTVGQEDTTP